MGKGDTYRPVDWKKYDKNYLRLYGVVCPRCGGKPRGVPCPDGGWTTCPRCNGLGYVEKPR
jgi:hypothetical protein